MTLVTWRTWYIVLEAGAMVYTNDECRRQQPYNHNSSSTPVSIYTREFYTQYPNVHTFAQRNGPVGSHCCIHRKLALVTSPSNSSTAECSPTLDLLRGHPSTSLLPTTAIYEAASVALNSPSLLPHDSYDETRHPLHYGPDQGNRIVREEIGRWAAERYRLRQMIAP